ncbi:polysaccharide deacetylase family protein [Bosea sp. SSUT16]|uniref:Chitooligosaccharide deacetylase n=2 Tax=Bosea spartocytisi TaxID=2773451 RepID=A0A927E9R3_9HYPH|nr:polysaccharide deacetylase family protein [Bosea spartocytisi]
MAAVKGIGGERKPMASHATEPVRGIEWPDRARAIVCVTIHVDGPAVEAGRGQNDLGVNSRGRYALRRGIRRYLDMLDRHAIKATFFCCGYDAEHWPEPFHEIHRAGHEIAAHGYQHEGFDLGEREPELLEKTHDILAALGQAPVGWCSPSGRKSRLTLPTLRRLGYIYDASEKDEDIPYLLEDGFMILPNNTVSLDDFPMYFSGGASAAEVERNFVQELDAALGRDGYVHLTVHPRAGGGSGTPARAAAVDRFLAYAKATPGVRFMTCRELAEYCLGDAARWQDARS